MEQLARLVEHRYDRGLPTITTSNYPTDGRVSRLALASDPVAGQRIISRLRDAGTQIRFDGPDRRQVETPHRGAVRQNAEG